MMKDKKLIIGITTFLIFCVIPFSIVYVAEEGRHNYKPENGYVSNAETAIKIAFAVWTPIYGAKQIESEKPYKAVLKEGVWFVSGSLPEGWKGGVAEAEINKDSGCIIRVSHGK